MNVAVPRAANAEVTPIGTTPTPSNATANVTVALVMILEFRFISGPLSIHCQRHLRWESEALSGNFSGYSGEFGRSFRSFRTPRDAVGGREATDVCVSR